MRFLRRAGSLAPSSVAIAPLPLVGTPLAPPDGCQLHRRVRAAHWCTHEPVRTSEVRSTSRNDTLERPAARPETTGSPEFGPLIHATCHRRPGRVRGARERSRRGPEPKYGEARSRSPGRARRSARPHVGVARRRSQPRHAWRAGRALPGVSPRGRGGPPRAGRGTPVGGRAPVPPGEKEAADESGCTPGSVTRSPRGGRGDGHPSRTGIAAGLVRSTRELGRAALGRSRRSTGVLPLDLAPGGVYLAVRVASDAGGLLHHRFTLTGDRDPRRSVFCGTVPRVTPGGR